jgi:hypothetical protein
VNGVYVSNRYVGTSAFLGPYLVLKLVYPNTLGANPIFDDSNVLARFLSIWFQKNFRFFCENLSENLSVKEI